MRLLGFLALAAALWAAVAVLCLLVGSSGSFGWPEGFDLIDRRERVLLASLVGASLAAAGVAYQAVLRNPLAEPYLLGVSSGAMVVSYVWQSSLGVTLLGGFTLALGEHGCAFFGALLSVGVVFALAGRRGRLEPVTLLLVGVIVNAVNGSLFLLLDAISKEMPGSGGPLRFLVGGIRTPLATAHQVIAVCIGAAGFVLLLAISGRLNAGMLSDDEASALGVGVQRLRWLALGVGSLMTASAVAVVGPIGFIGLICPHLARLMVGVDVRRVLPLATGLGAALLTLADAISRLLARESAAGTKLPVGVLTGLLGGPFFLLLLWQNRRTTGGAS